MKKIMITALALALALSTAGCAGHTPGQEGRPATATDAAGESAAVPEETTEAFVTETDGFAFSDLFAYAGPYVEDGSNEEVDNVAAIRVENRSGQALRYAEITVSTGAGDLHFTCTTLLPGRSALLLEQNRAAFAGSAANGIRFDSKGFFEEAPTLYPDTFSVSVNGHVLTLRNITSRPVAGEIYVYYKRSDSQGYLGGITYRVRFADLAAGAEASMSSQNLSVQDCDILFIDCENPPEAAQ
ncbi:MAG: hypothetical protein IJK98_02715 [Clostridia bacterium]|nr:hypothetical protein [Clostridia bacterium]